MHGGENMHGRSSIYRAQPKPIRALELVYGKKQMTV